MKRFVWFPVGLGLLCVCCLAVFLAAPPAARAAGDGTIVGTVKNASGTTGLPDIWVVAFQPDGSGGWTKFDSAQTAADGSYRLDLPTGSYGIEFHDNSGTYVTECYKNEPNRDLAKFVQVTAGETHLGIDATLARAGHIQGTVKNASLAGLPGIYVNAFQSDDSGGWTKFGSTQTAADGSYRLDLPTGNYFVVFHDSSGAYAEQCYDDEPNNDLADKVPVSARQTISGIDATLARAGHIQGTVTDASADPLSGISAVAFQSDGSGGWTKFGSTQTAADGSYRLDLPTGSYRIQFQDSSGTYARQCYKNKFNLSMADDVAVTAGQTTPSSIDATLMLAPYGAMLLDNGAAATNSTTVTADSMVNGATEMRFAAYDGTAWVYTDWQSYTFEATVTIYAPDGVKRVVAYYRAANGHVFSTSDTIVLDTVPPSGIMRLNHGAAATNMLTVWANSYLVTGATWMRFAAYNGTAWVYSDWQPYAAYATVTIYAPDGTKRVKAYYRDDAGNTYTTSDTIVLDTVAPSGTMQLNRGAAATSSTSVTADSAVSGATEMQFASYNGSAWVYSAWQPYAATATVTIYAPDGTKRVYADYRDAAGNSYKTSDTIILSTR